MSRSSGHSADCRGPYRETDTDCYCGFQRYKFYERVVKQLHEVFDTDNAYADQHDQAIENLIARAKTFKEFPDAVALAIDEALLLDIEFGETQEKRLERILTATVTLVFGRDCWKKLASFVLAAAMESAGDVENWENMPLPPMELLDNWKDNPKAVQERVQAWWENVIARVARCHHETVFECQECQHHVCMQHGCEQHVVPRRSEVKTAVRTCMACRSLAADTVDQEGTDI